jgi:hypothetical protein
MKRKKKNLMVNGYKCLRIEREEVSKKKERLRLSVTENQRPQGLGRV